MQSSKSTSNQMFLFNAIGVFFGRQASIARRISKVVYLRLIKWFEHNFHFSFLHWVDFRWFGMLIVSN